MSLLTDDLIMVDLPDNNWHLIDPFTGLIAITVKNASPTSVSIFKTTEDLLESSVNDYLISNNINPPEVGGLTYEISTVTGERLYARCNESTGVLSVRKYGTVDPMTDVESLGGILNEMLFNFNSHVSDNTNPHEVNKEQVGLGEIPSNLVHDVLDEAYTTDNDDDAVVSLRGVRQTYDHADDHIKTIGNPHGTTKADVGLSQVANYPPATSENAMDVNNNQSYLTPQTATILIKDMAVVSSSMPPQLIVQGATGDRPESWTMSDSTLPSTTVIKLGATKISVEAGLQVSFMYSGISRLSKILTTAKTFDFPVDMGTSVQYLYIDLKANGDFTDIGYKEYVPTTAPMKDAYAGDFYNTSTFEMTDVDGDSYGRVYLAKVSFFENAIESITCVPIGIEAIVPVTEAMILGGSIIIENPYLAPVEATALLRLDGKWGDTKWNDQTGVMANPRPGYENTHIVVQAGLVGFVTKGSSAGNAFGSNFTTITDPQRVAVKLRKLY